MYITIARECDNCGGEYFLLITDEHPSTEQVEAIKDKVPPVCGLISINKIEKDLIQKLEDASWTR